MIKAKFKLLLEFRNFRITFIVFFFLPNFKVTTENILEYFNNVKLEL
jgi:hypothetical protein